ncbi:hypothetical protein P7L66_04280 (plasmid) [Tistrella mobilis]|uniref:SGNH/GDSL hydrolase family protein n=1 Tax=Tistrella mobilis TaxID=171437 RepID=UPI003558BDFB
MRRVMRALVLVLVGIGFGCLAGEGLVRLGTANQKNYVIEMWRYAKLLKRPSDDPAVGHEHVPGASARLQNVEISINALGLRGPEPVPGRPAVVLAGDSTTLGWGVEQDDTLAAQLARRLGGDVQVLNAGVGNMTVPQIVAHWLEIRRRIGDAFPIRALVLLPSSRAGLPQPAGDAGWLVRHSELAALVATFWGQATSGAAGRDEMIAAYRAAWTGPEGRARIAGAFDGLAAETRADGIRVIVAQLPDTNDFRTYDFGFLAETSAREATARGWEFVDLYPPFAGETAADYWVMSGDIHLNAKAFGRIADRLAPLLAAPAS